MQEFDQEGLENHREERFVFFKNVKEKIKKAWKLLIERNKHCEIEHIATNYESKAYSNVTKVPFYAIGPKDTPFPNIPIFFSLIEVSIVGHYEDHEGNDNFVLELCYQKCMVWTIHRQVIDFVKLHYVLLLHHIQGRLPDIPEFSILSYWLNRAKLITMKQKNRIEIIHQIDVKRQVAFESYLRKILVDFNLHPCHELCEFLELGAIGILYAAPHKRKEFYLRKRIFNVKNGCSNLCRVNFVEKWFSLQSSCLIFTNHINDREIRGIMLVDPMFKIKEESKKKQIVISNSYLRIEIKVKEKLTRLSLIDQMRQNYVNCEWNEINRHDSFAPIRKCSNVKLFADGAALEAIFDAIKSATNEIFIHDWHLSPEVYLKRPLISSYRLDHLLKVKADAGVRIFVIVYKEIQLALGNNSFHAKSVLSGLHPNIKVLRFPNAYGGPLYWAIHDKIVVIDQKIAFVGGMDLAFGRFDTGEHLNVDPEEHMWQGQDYYNPMIRDFRNIENYKVSSVDRKVYPRMGWHDTHCRTKGQIANDIGRHFIQKWNYIKNVKYGDYFDSIPFIVPREIEIDPDENERFEIQALRSVGSWSLAQNENSIYKALVYEISNAKHFIYIENQFFLSSLQGKEGFIKNTFIDSLFQRIKKAFSSNEKLKIVVLLPLLPSFEGGIEESFPLRTIVQSQLGTIRSLIGQLQADGIDYKKFIQFVSLRKIGKIGEKYVTEQTYVHSKVAIFDDRTVIIGSANLNDRSLLGYHDSEFNLLIKENEVKTMQLGGNLVSVGKSVHEFRIKLFCEHLGIDFSSDSVSNITDPLSDSFHQMITSTSSMNTHVFREIFHCIPDDEVKNWSDYYKFRNAANEMPDKKTTEDLIVKLKGHFVEYPLKFMEEVNLEQNFGFNAENFLPKEVFM